MTETQPEETVYESHRRLSDGVLFDVLTEIPNPADPFFEVTVRSQESGRRHHVRVQGLVKKYERVS